MSLSTCVSSHAPGQPMWQVKNRIEISLVPCAFVPACPRACVSGLTTSRRCRHPVVGSQELYSNRINQMTYICDTRAGEGDAFPSEPAMLSLKRGKTRCRVPRVTRSPCHQVTRSRFSRPVNANPRRPQKLMRLMPLPVVRRIYSANSPA